jgi:predicted nucleotidyltransferase
VLIKNQKKLLAFLDQVSSEITRLYGTQHGSTILHGGIVLGEFSSSFSDIDLIVVLSYVTEEDAYTLAEAWDRWSAHPFGDKLWIHLLSAEQLKGRMTMGWTICKKGVMPFHGMPIDEMELHTLLHHGKTLRGSNVINQFPKLSADYSIKGLQKFQRILQKYSSVSPMQPYRDGGGPDEDEISLLLTFPRHLYNLKTDNIITKCQAAKWYARNYKTYADDLLRLAKYRMNPQKGLAKEVLKAFAHTPQLLTYFWSLYFKELGVKTTIPEPIQTPEMIYYGDTFAAIHYGLEHANST